MKQILMLTLSLCLIFSACEKSKDEPSIEGKTCQIASVAYEQLTYDEQGRITKIWNGNAGSAGTSIFYEKDLVKILGPKNSPDIHLFLTGDRVAKAEDYEQKIPYTFTYNADGYLSEVVMLRGGETYKAVYTYTNGNLTKLQTSNLSKGVLTLHPETIIEYSTELASNIADIGVPIESPFSFNLYKVSKYFGKQSKNLVSKMTKADVILTYTYVKDANGNITSVKRSGLDPYLIKYSCK